MGLSMKVGDILMGGQLDQLPVGSVVVLDENGGFNSVTRTPSGYTWVNGRGSNSSADTFGHGGISVGDWTVVHLPPAPALKVGDAVTSEEQARALPVGSVVIDTEDAAPHRAPSIKVGDDKWLFEGIYPSGPQHCCDADVYGDGEDVVVYIPARADTGAGSTAA